jgi:hypothetical protein
MDNRTKGIIATIAAVVLCGCPGLFLCIFGVLAATGTPVTTELNGITNVAPMPASSAYVMLCLSVILILIPIAVGFFTLRRKPAAAMPSEPIPPAM